MTTTEIKSPLLINASAYPDFYDGLDRQLRLGMCVSIGTLHEKFTVIIIVIEADHLVGQVCNYLHSEKFLKWGDFCRFAYCNVMATHAEMNL